MQKIGVIGMGTMGIPMALNLIKAGFNVTVFNRTRGKCDSVLQAGATLSTSPRELASESDVILLVLADDEAVKRVVLDDDGVASGLKPNQIVIDSSTVHPDTSRYMASTLATRQAIYLDAPVTGSRPEAEAGNLAFLVAGSELHYQTCVPVFEAMGCRHEYLGQSGSGACVKLANNTMGLIHLAALVEALQMVESYRIDLVAFLRIIGQSGARSAVVENKGPKILSHNFEVDFSLANGDKDLRLAKQLAKSMGIVMPVLTATSEVYKRSASMADDDSDVCGIYRWYRHTRKMVQM